MAVILSARHMKSPVLCTMDRETGFRIIRPQILNGKKIHRGLFGECLVTQQSTYK